jgi:regulator of protease activity HflC (stomatin/prohibitin superfamily)
MAQTSLRSIIGKSDLDDLLSTAKSSTRAWS